VQSSRTSATSDDVIAAPEHLTAELIDSELFLRPRPGVRHIRTAMRMFRSLGSRDADGDDPPGWVLGSEVELHLGHPDPRSLVMVPDASGWRSERVPEIEHAVAVEVVPDWVCEVLSPGNARHDRLTKMNRYAALGVAWAWLVDPAERLLEVYELVGGVWTRVQTGGPDDTLVVAPFGVEVKLRGWFGV
jgi:hypothetical protein